MSLMLSRRNKLPIRRSSCRLSTSVSADTAKFNKTRDRATQEEAIDEIIALKAANAGKAEHGIIQQIIDKYFNAGFPCVNRAAIDYRMKLRMKGIKMLPYGNHHPNEKVCAKESETIVNHHPSEVVIPAETETIVSPITPIPEVTNNSSSSSNTNNEVISRNVGGRKVGQTKKAKLNHNKNIKIALTEASKKLAAARKACNSGRVADGTLIQIISEVEDDLKLVAGTLKPKTIIARVYKNNLTGVASQKVSPLSPVEELLVQMIARLSRMNEPLSKSSIQHLADDIIRGTVHEDNLREFCKKRQINKEGEQLVGTGWYEGFMTRNSDRLTRKKVKIRDRKRTTWCTKQHFANMYNSVYAAMVDCGVAEELDEEIMYDKDGIETKDPLKMCGRPSRYRMLKPERCLYVDETGCNTNQKADGYLGGEYCVVEVGQQEIGRNGSVTDIHFTVLPFIAGTGEAVMCAVVLKSNKDAKDTPIKWRLGIDITREPIAGETEIELFENNTSELGTMSGGPVCRFNGKDIPCFVCSSPKSSITTELLCKMLKFIDEQGIFPRSGPNDTPFLLLDGHQSRTKLEFLEYICDDEHQWTCCIGVPYGTHIWQPADSSELNGSFKIALTKAKMNYTKHKDLNNRSFKTTDVIPLINEAWKKSLGRKEFARKAILNRGWLALNYVLLDDPRLIDEVALTESDAQQEDLSVNTRIETEEDRLATENLMNSINRSGRVYTTCLDALVQEEKRSEGRQLAFREKQKQNKSKKEKLDTFEEMGNVTSARLALESYYSLDKDLRDAFRRVKQRKDGESSALKKRKATAFETDDVKFRIAAEKYKGSKDLTIPEMRSILKRIPPPPNRKDSPMKTRQADLVAQLHRRRSRICLYFDPLWTETVNNGESDDSVGLRILSDALFGEDVSGCTTTIGSSSSSTMLFGESGDDPRLLFHTTASSSTGNDNGTIENPKNISEI